jgi:hypothetical protein
MGEYANSPRPGFVAFIHLHSIPLPNRSLARQFEQEAQSMGAPGRGGQLI